MRKERYKTHTLKKGFFTDSQIMSRIATARYDLNNMTGILVLFYLFCRYLKINQIAENSTMANNNKKAGYFWWLHCVRYYRDCIEAS